MTCHDLASGRGCTLGGAPSQPRVAQPYGRFWDRESKQVYGPFNTTPPFARYRSALVLTDWGVIAPDATAVVGELASNAVQATQRASLETPVSVRLLSGPGRLVIEVADQAPGAPQVCEADADAESGRGLLLVAAFSTYWGWYPHNQGKVVYADLAP